MKEELEQDDVIFICLKNLFMLLNTFPGYTFLYVFTSAIILNSLLSMLYPIF